MTQVARHSIVIHGVAVLCGAGPHAPPNSASEAESLAGIGGSRLNHFGAACARQLGCGGVPGRIKGSVRATDVRANGTQFSRCENGFQCV